MALILPSDRFFVAGANGMAGSAIVRALQRAGYGNPEQGGALLTPRRGELDLLDDLAVQNWVGSNRCSGASCRPWAGSVTAVDQQISYCKIYVSNPGN